MTDQIFATKPINNGKEKKQKSCNEKGNPYPSKREENKVGIPLVHVSHSIIESIDTRLHVRRGRKTDSSTYYRRIHGPRINTRPEIFTFITRSRVNTCGWRRQTFTLLEID